MTWRTVIDNSSFTILRVSVWLLEIFLQLYRDGWDFVRTSWTNLKLCDSGWGGGPRTAEKDAAARERPRPDSGEADGRQPEARREREGPPERESLQPLQTWLIQSFSFSLFFQYCISLIAYHHLNRDIVMMFMVLDLALVVLGQPSRPRKRLRLWRRRCNSWKMSWPRPRLTWSKPLTISRRRRRLCRMWVTGPRGVLTSVVMLFVCLTSHCFAKKICTFVN